MNEILRPLGPMSQFSMFQKAKFKRAFVTGISHSLRGIFKFENITLNLVGGFNILAS